MPRLDGQDPRALVRAAQSLAEGRLVAFPTETVYGLGARADRPAAVRAVFDAKGRPADHPLIVHVADASAAAAFSDPLGGPAAALMSTFWPGPLTVIVPRRAGVAREAAGGQASIGLRAPAHPIAQALLHAAARLGVPGVAAPSANRFGRVSPTTADHVEQEFGDAMLIVDGGPCEVGIESTIVDCTRASHPSLLRPGLVGRAEIEACLGRPLVRADSLSPRASGTLESHYAPTARLRLMDAQALRAAVTATPADELRRVALYSRSMPRAGALAAQRRMPDVAALAAQELFAALRSFDDLGAAQIWVETPPDSPEWEGVNDRLRRAAAA